MPLDNPTDTSQFCAVMSVIPAIAPVPAQSLKSVTVPVIPSVVSPITKVQEVVTNVGGVVVEIGLPMLPVPTPSTKTRLSMSLLKEPEYVRNMKYALYWVLTITER